MPRNSRSTNTVTGAGVVLTRKDSDAPIAAGRIAGLKDGIGEAILAAGERLTNLHVADSNRGALGEGSLDVDTLIMALYCIGYNQPGCYVTPEPLGPGGDPYPAMNGQPDPALLDRLVGQTARYFREREEAVLEGR